MQEQKQPQPQEPLLGQPQPMQQMGQQQKRQLPIIQPQPPVVQHDAGSQNADVQQPVHALLPPQRAAAAAAASPFHAHSTFGQGNLTRGQWESTTCALGTWSEEQLLAPHATA